MTELKNRILGLMKTLDRNGVTAAKEVREMVHGLAKNAGKKGN